MLVVIISIGNTEIESVSGYLSYLRYVSLQKLIIMYQFSFEKLNVWQKARALTKKIYDLTSKFPKEEVFCLTNQLRRASISICSNLAEGSSRRSDKEQQHLYQISYSSLMELYNQLIIAKDLGYINKDDLDEIRDDVQHISILHTRLRESLVN